MFIDIEPKSRDESLGSTRQTEGSLGTTKPELPAGTASATQRYPSFLMNARNMLYRGTTEVQDDK
ncbi:hypothetical protein BGZ65_009693, partial [Modicella reniformis]